MTTRTVKASDAVLAQMGDQTTEVTSSTTSMPKEAIIAPRKLPMPPKMMIARSREIRS